MSMAPPSQLRSDADVAEGVAWLSTVEPALAAAAEVTGPVRLRQRVPGFATLLHAIVSQQVSVASADAIWRRLEDAALVAPDAVACAGEGALKACGLSRQKIRYAIALSESGIDFDGLHALPDATVIETLTAVPGIGVWTAEVYTMFALRRPDVFAAGDLALQEAVRVAFDLDARPSETVLRSMAEGWTPWRTVAATLLWQYYARVKGREGVTTK